MAIDKDALNDMEALSSLAKNCIAFVTREVVNELSRIKKTSSTDAVKIDVLSLVQDLSSRPLNGPLQHLMVGNHRFVAMLAEMNRRAAADTHDFVDDAMPGAVFHPDQMRYIEPKAKEIMALDGYILDLGVYKGSSTKRLAKIFPDHTIHGFDSFEGLPGDWTHALKGSFGDVKGILPDMPDNVVLYKGWFEDTLPVWLEDNNSKPISLLRVDCDIYSSTKTIFTVLAPLIKSGTWIVFDELIGYRGWRHHEHKAFMEFIDATGFEYQYVAFGLTYVILYIK